MCCDDIHSCLRLAFPPWRGVTKKDAEDPGNESGNPTEGKDSEVPSIEEPINRSKISLTVNTDGTEVNVVDPKTSIELLNDPNMLELEDIVYSDDDEDVGVEADMNNLNAFMPMDVKSAFLYGKIKEEVYVCQPPVFEDLDFPDRVYKVEKALYGLHQAPKVYVDDIIFGSTMKKLCTEFENMMHKKFEMSSMGELTFFLGLQVKQKEDEIFIS
ncbi:putative ribonuclease H-like domain-containing protein [Tanacetum coccineum]